MSIRQDRNFRIGISIREGRLPMEHSARSPTSRAPTGGRRRARRLVRAPRGPWERRFPWGERCRRGPIRRAGGTAAHAEGPRVVAGRRGCTQVTGGASADGRGARDVPRLAGAGVDRGLRGPACASREVRVRRWVRIWSITDVWVKQATRRIAPWQDGHACGAYTPCTRRCESVSRLRGSYPSLDRVGPRPLPGSAGE